MDELLKSLANFMFKEINPLLVTSGHIKLFNKKESRIFVVFLILFLKHDNCVIFQVVLIFYCPAFQDVPMLNLKYGIVQLVVRNLFYNVLYQIEMLPTFITTHFQNNIR